MEATFSFITHASQIDGECSAAADAGSNRSKWSAAGGIFSATAGCFCIGSCAGGRSRSGRMDAHALEFMARAG